MDIFQLIRLTTISRRVKLLALIMLLVYFCLATFWLISGYIFPRSPDTLMPGVTLLAALLPIILLLGFITFYESGVPVLQRATSKFLLDTLPQILRGAGEDRKVAAEEFHQLGEKPPVSRPHSKVAIHYTPGAQKCIYKIETDVQRSLLLAAEINVRKANICLYFRKDLIPQAQQDISAYLQEHLRHSIGGARSEGYKVNNDICIHDIAGVEHWALVLIKDLDKEFLWSPAEQLYFSQDLVYLLRSVVNEKPEWLVTEAATDEPETPEENQALSHTILRG